MSQQIINPSPETHGDARSKINANFTELYLAKLDNTIIVKQASDFGAIDSTKQYFLDGVIDMTGQGSIEVPSGGINIKGYDFNTSGIVCADAAYTLFTSPVGGSGDVLFSNFKVEITGVGSQVYDLVADTGFEAHEVDKINWNDCTSRGTISGYRQGLETGTGLFGGTPQLTLDGTWLGGYFIDTSIVRSLVDGAYSLYKAGATFSMASRFRTNQNIDLPATVSLFDFATANFTNPSTLQLQGCILSRNGVFDASDSNVTPNILASDLKCDWAGNNGIPNTFIGGESSVSSEATTTISVDGSFVDIAGTFAVADMQHFDSPANGQLRHLGTSPRNYNVLAQFALESSANDLVALKGVIYRAATTSFEDAKTIRRTIDSLSGTRDVGHYTYIDSIILNQNDYFKFQVANIGDTSDVIAELDSSFNISVR